VPKIFSSDEERRAYNAEKSRRWREKNPEQAKAAKKKYYASEKGRAQKRKEDAAFIASGGRAVVEARRALKPVSAARRAVRAKWAANNKAYFTAMRSYRRTLEKELDACDFWVLKEAVLLARLREVVVGGKWHVDHIVPVSKGGNSRPDNLQVVPAIWNRRKSNVHAKRFIGA
jgi:HNH endonuclease